MGQVLGVVSPHLDDGVLSCGRLLAANPGSIVVTVFAGGPASVDPLPPWDAAAGVFAVGENVMARRRDEDEAACALLRVTAHHLGWWDVQYRHAHYGYAGPFGDELVDAVATDLMTVVDTLSARAWVVPMGLRHADHELAAAAALSVAQSTDRDWIVYEELPYRLFSRSARRAAVANLHAAGFALQPAEGLEVRHGRSIKRRAIDRYGSQRHLLGLGTYRSVLSAERYHRLARR